MIFHSTLILWAYSLLLNITSKFDQKRIITPLEINLDTPIVLLNEDWSSATDRFIDSNDIIPCLRAKDPNKNILGSKEISRELILLSIPEDIIDFSIEINNRVAFCGLLSSDISKVLKSLRDCSKEIISI